MPYLLISLSFGFGLFCNAPGPARRVRGGKSHSTFQVALPLVALTQGCYSVLAFWCELFRIGSGGGSGCGDGSAGASTRGSDVVAAVAVLVRVLVMAVSLLVVWSLQL